MRRDMEVPRDGGGGGDRADPVARIGPGHMAEQPGARRHRAEIHLRRLGHGAEIEPALLPAEGVGAGMMHAARAAAMGRRRSVSTSSGGLVSTLLDTSVQR